MKILVTGGSGFIGSAMANYFSARGYEVLATARSEAKPAHLHPDINYICADLVNHLEPIEADICIHCAGLASDTATYEDLFAANVDATGNLMDALKNCSTFIFISSSSVYMPVPDCKEENSESKTNFNELSPYGKTKLQAEKLVLAHSAIPGKIILRPRAVYGKGDKHLLPRILGAVVNRKLFTPGMMNISISMTHIDNLIYAAELCMQTRTENSNSIFNVADDETYILREVIREILAKYFDENISIIPIPPALLRILLYLSKITGIKMRSRITPFIIDSFTRSHTLNLNSITKNLGYKPQKKFRDFID